MKRIKENCKENWIDREERTIQINHNEEILKIKKSNIKTLKCMGFKKTKTVLNRTDRTPMLPVGSLSIKVSGKSVSI